MRLSAEARRDMRSSFASPGEVGGLLVPGPGGWRVASLSTGGVAKVRVVAGEVMFHTHPGVCTNSCDVRGVCVRVDDACGMSPPSHRDVEGFVSLAGACRAHLVVFSAGDGGRGAGGFLMRANPNLRRDVSRAALSAATRRMLARRGAGAGPIEVLAKRASSVAKRLEDAFSRDFMRTTSAAFEAGWMRAMDGLKIDGVTLLSVERFDRLEDVEI